MGELEQIPLGYAGEMTAICVNLSVHSECTEFALECTVWIYAVEAAIDLHLAVEDESVCY